MYRGFENPRLFKDRPTDGKRSGCAASLLAVAFLIMRACVLVPTLYMRMQWAARVSLADWLALGGKGTGGLKTPGYSKTVLRTENAAAAPHPF